MAVVEHLIKVIDPSYRMAEETLAHLAARPWPGNIRELRNMISRLTLAAADGLADRDVIAAMINQSPSSVVSGSLHEIQLANIRTVHINTSGNVSETARRLGISRNTVYPRHELQVGEGSSSSGSVTVCNRAQTSALRSTSVLAPILPTPPQPARDEHNLPPP
jgi:DNA-binding NtrC family response regulator